MSEGNQIIAKVKEFPLVVVCLIVIIVCALFNYLRSDVTSQLTAQEADLNSRIWVLDFNAKNSKNLNEEMDELEVLVEQIESRLFNREQRAVNTNFFYSLEDRLDVQMSNISQLTNNKSIHAKGGPRELKLYSTIGFSLAVNGSYEEILTFFYELYRVVPFIRVSNVNISSAQDGKLVARIVLHVLAESN